MTSYKSNTTRLSEPSFFILAVPPGRRILSRSVCRVLRCLDCQIHWLVEISLRREMQEDLERCEPRVLSLQETANHLLEEHVDIRERLQELRLRLQSLKRLTSMYVLKIGATLGLDPRDVGLPAVTSLAVLSQDVSPYLWQ
jgi:phage baseplate assembly protein W